MPMPEKAKNRSFWRTHQGYHLTGSEQCRGCGSLLASKLILRAIYEHDRSAMVFGRSCGGGRSELQTGGRIGVDGSGMMGIEAAMRARGELAGRTLVVLTGEGRALEMGAGDFLASFDRGQKLTWIILDNQAYANSGSAATALTPFKAATRIFSRPTGGKPTPARQMPLMMVFSPAAFVATATLAYPEDLAAKVRLALAHQPSYVHVYAPCQVSWMYEPDRVVELSRRMAQTGVAPLWRFHQGVFRRTLDIRPYDRLSVAGFLKLQKRYQGLSPDELLAIEEEISALNQTVDRLERAFDAPVYS